MHPNATNGEISSMLATVWKEAPTEIKKEYVEREARLREQYKRDIAAWTEASRRGTLPPSPEQADNKIMGDDQIEEYEEYCQQVLVKSEIVDPENDEKPPAVEGQSNRQDQETQSNIAGYMEESSEGQPRAPMFEVFTQHQEQHVDAHEHNNDTLSHQRPKYAVARNSNKAGSDTSSSSDEKSLAPLTSSDIGGFLAAAAMLDASPDRGNVHSMQQEEHDFEYTAKPPASATTGVVARDWPMAVGVRKVVSQLPPESMKDEDLPTIPTPP
jgi:HMG (high mobility group) box